MLLLKVCVNLSRNFNKNSKKIFTIFSGPVSFSSMKQLRAKAEQNNSLRDAYIESMEPVIAKLKARFRLVKWAGEHVSSHDAAKQEEIDQIKSLLDPGVQGDLDKFIKAHCQQRHYSFQVANYGV